MAEDKLSCWRSVSILPTSSDSVMSRSLAITFSAFQNASSRLTLVLWPAMTVERLMTEDFIACPPAKEPTTRDAVDDGPDIFLCNHQCAVIGSILLLPCGLNLTAGGSG